MASTDDVKKLAALARLDIPEKELARFASEFESILTYISQIEGLSVEGEDRPLPTTRNILRDDGEPREPGVCTAALAEQFPEREGDALKVKQIISHD